MELDYLGAGQVLGSRLGEPHHQDGADGKVRDDEHLQRAFERQRVELFKFRPAEAARADDSGYALLESGADVAGRSIRLREVDRRVEPGEIRLLPTPNPPHLMTGRLESRREHRADLATVPEQRDFHAARASSGLTRSTAARKRFSLGPIPAAESFSGARSTPASSASSSASTASISAMIRSIESSSVSEISDFPSRLIRFEVDSIESMIRPFMFSFARASSSGRRLPAAMSAICSRVISRQSRKFSSRVPM